MFFFITSAIIDYIRLEFNICLDLGLSSYKVRQRIIFYLFFAIIFICPLKLKVSLQFPKFKNTPSNNNRLIGLRKPYQNNLS